MCDFLSLAAPGVQKLKPYIPGKPIEELERELGIENIIKLASNENPLGPSPRGLQAAEAVLAEVNLYPDGSGYALKQVLAKKHGVDPEQITLGNGSNDVLVLLAEGFLTPEHSAVYSQYCFAVYPIAVQAVGAIHKQVPALGWGSHSPLGNDLQAMHQAIDENTRLVFVANPNNPTGSYLDAEELRNFVAAVPANVIVVIDEAYLEYAPQDKRCNASQWLPDFPNLVVTRTFSKAYGLAGLRVGYALSHPDIANILNRIRQPFNVNVPALAAAQAALDDTDFIEQARIINQDGMQILQDSCQRLGLRYVPSTANFLLVDFGRDAMPIFDGLLQAGIITRPVANYGLPECLRITIGTPEQMQRLDTALEQVLRA